MGGEGGKGVLGGSCFLEKEEEEEEERGVDLGGGGMWTKKNRN